VVGDKGAATTIKPLTPRYFVTVAEGTCDSQAAGIHQSANPFGTSISAVIFELNKQETQSNALLLWGRWADGQPLTQVRFVRSTPAPAQPYNATLPGAGGEIPGWEADLLCPPVLPLLQPPETLLAPLLERLVAEWVLPHLNSTTRIKGTGGSAFDVNTGFTVSVVVGNYTWVRGFEPANPLNKVSPGAGEPVSGDTPFRIGSISKVFTSYLLFALRDAGVVSLDDKLSKYSGPPGAGVRFESPQLFSDSTNITLRQLASFSAGLTRTGFLPLTPKSKLPLNRTAASPDNEFVSLLDWFTYPEVLWDQDTRDSMNGYNLTDLVEIINSDPYAAVVPQNSVPEYSNLQTGLLGAALDNAIKSHPEFSKRYPLGLPDFFQQEVAAPLGMTNTAFSVSPALLPKFPGPRPPPPACWSATYPFQGSCTNAQWERYSSSSANPMYLQNSTSVITYLGGMSSTAHDMAKWAAYLLRGFNPEAQY